MRDVEISLTVPGAPADSIAAGVDAAWRVFEQAEAWPWDAAAAAFDLEGLEFKPESEDLSADAYRLAEVWELAVDSAYKAACPTYPVIPPGVNFELIGTPIYRRPRG